MSTWEHGAPHLHESSLGQCRGPEQLVGSFAKRRRHHKSLLVPAKSSVKLWEVCQELLSRARTFKSQEKKEDQPGTPRRTSGR